MAQAPQKPAIPSAPAPAARAQVNIHGQAPQPNMAPPDDDISEEGLGDNTRAEMAAGKANLQKHGRRNNAEHEAGRRVNRQRSGAPEPDTNDTETNPQG